MPRRREQAPPNTLQPPGTVLYLHPGGAWRDPPPGPTLADTGNSLGGPPELHGEKCLLLSAAKLVTQQ